MAWVHNSWSNVLKGCHFTSNHNSTEIWLKMTLKEIQPTKPHFFGCPRCSGPCRCNFCMKLVIRYIEIPLNMYLDTLLNVLAPPATIVLWLGHFIAFPSVPCRGGYTVGITRKHFRVTASEMRRSIFRRYDSDDDDRFMLYIVTSTVYKL